jgi:hypothetical protein
MLGWLKDKINGGAEAELRARLISGVSAQFGQLEKVKNAVPDIASRLANFVVDGDDQRELSDLKASQGNHFIYSSRDDWSAERKSSFDALLKSLSPDLSRGLSPDLAPNTDRLVRFALALEAAYGNQSFYGSAAVPGFAGRCEWIVTFLKFVANAADANEKNFPAESVAAMLASQGADASLLASGAFLVQDAQGKLKFSYWHPTP